MENFETLIVQDTLDDFLTLIPNDQPTVHVSGDNPPNLTDQLTVDHKTVTLTLPRDYNFATLAGRTLTVEIPAQVVDTAEVEAIAHVYPDGIPNTAKLTFNDKVMNSGTVTVTPPGIVPELGKTVNAQTSITLNHATDDIVYNLTLRMPNNLTGYDAW